MPGEPKYKKKNDSYIEFLELKEFTVGKKYCLWGTKDWDDKCQDAAMEYAFGESWKELKKVALDFIKYTREKNIEKLMTSLDWRCDEEHDFSIALYSRDKNRLYQRPIQSFSLWQPESSEKECWEKELTKNEYKNFLKLRVDSNQSTTLSNPKEWLEVCINHIIEDWVEDLERTEYKDFLLVSDDGRDYNSINISKYMIIYFVRKNDHFSGKYDYSAGQYNVPKIRRINYY